MWVTPSPMHGEPLSPAWASMDLDAVVGNLVLVVSVLVAALLSFAVVFGFLTCLTHLLLLWMGANHREAAADGTGELEHPRSTFVYAEGAALPETGGLLPGELASLPIFAYSPIGGAESEEYCAVCLTQLEENHCVRGLPRCHHSLHVECIDQWLRCSATCPVCRSPVKPESHVIELPPPPREDPSSPPPMPSPSPSSPSTSSSGTPSDEEFGTHLTSSLKAELELYMRHRIDLLLTRALGGGRRYGSGEAVADQEAVAAPGEEQLLSAM